jgi:hypothetical protein
MVVGFGLGGWDMPDGAEQAAPPTFRRANRATTGRNEKRPSLMLNRLNSFVKYGCGGKI